MRRYRHFLLCLAVVLSAGLGFASRAGAQLIHTVAGGGPNNIPAISASFGPSGVAVDLNGNTYVASANQSRVFKIDASGTLTVVAGTGTPGYNGDGITATTAELYYPYGVAVDSSGNIYIADFDNFRIRVVNEENAAAVIAGVTIQPTNIATIGGNGTLSFSGDGYPATDAELHYPWGVALDGSGNIYIADLENSRIRVVNKQATDIQVAGVTIHSGDIATVAGTGTAGYTGDGSAATTAELYFPYGVAVDSSGNIYIADQYNQRIRKVNGSSGLIGTVAGGGSNGLAARGESNWRNVAFVT